MNYESVLCRKVIAAAVTSLLLSGILAILYARPLEFNTFGWWWVYLIYAGPVILIYGTTTSFISDFIARFIARKTTTWKFQRLYSLVFHLLFALVLWWISLLAAVIFFVMDILLDKWKPVYEIKQAFIGLAIPVGCWLLFILVMNLVE